MGIIRMKDSKNRYPAFHARLSQLIGTQEPYVWAKAVGIPPGTFVRIWKQQAVPKHEHLIRIARHANVSLDWLLLGEDSQALAKASGSTMPLPSPEQQQGLSVVGLAACHIHGWEQQSAIHQRAPKLPRLSERAFAVIAIGDSLTPMGIENGMLCYCDPDYELQPGDIVYLERKDQTASLKRYDYMLDISGHPALSVSGWQEQANPQDAEAFAGSGIRQPSRYQHYRLDIDLTQLVRYAPVVYVKRKF